MRTLLSVHYLHYNRKQKETKQVFWIQLDSHDSSKVRFFSGSCYITQFSHCSTLTSTLEKYLLFQQFLKLPHATLRGPLLNSHWVVSDSFATPWIIAFQGSSVHWISQARIWEWVAISFSRRSSRFRESNSNLLHWQADSLPLSHEGSPQRMGFLQ